MPLETYRLEVTETANREGLSAAVYGEDGLVEASTSVPYEEYGLEPVGGSRPSAKRREVTADVTATDLQIERDDAGFSFRLLGDRDELATLRVEDEEWGLSSE